MPAEIGQIASLAGFSLGGAITAFLGKHGVTILKACWSGAAAQAEKHAKESDAEEQRRKRIDERLWQMMQEENKRLGDEARELRKRCSELETDCHQHRETGRAWERIAHDMWHPMNNAVQRFNSLLITLQKFCTKAAKPAGITSEAFSRLRDAVSAEALIEPPARLPTFDRISSTQGN